MVDSQPFQGLQPMEFKLTGLQRGLARLWKTRAADDKSEAAIAVFEAMSWVHSFQDGQRRAIATNDRELAVLLGVCGARNAMHHADFDPLEWKAAGLRYPIDASAYPIVDRGEGYLDWCWRSGIPKIREDEQRLAYIEQLEGNLVRFALTEVGKMCDRFVATRGDRGPSTVAGRAPGDRTNAGHV